MRPSIVADENIPDRVWKHAMSPGTAALLKNSFRESIKDDSVATEARALPSESIGMFYGFISGESKSPSLRHSPVYDWCIAFAPYDTPVLAFAFCVERGRTSEPMAAAGVRRLIAAAEACGYFSNDRVAAN